MATGYVTTANYVGEVTHEGVDSITYRVTYVGSAIVEPEPDPEPVEPTEGERVPFWEKISPEMLPYAAAGVGVISLAALAVLLFQSRREVRALRAEELKFEDEQEENGA